MTTARYCLVILALLSGAICTWGVWDSGHGGNWGWALIGMVCTFINGGLGGFWVAHILRREGKT